MFYRECEDCGCSLDPGEGRVCDDCKNAREQESVRKTAVKLIVKPDMVVTGFRQMELEEMLDARKVM